MDNVDKTTRSIFVGNIPYEATEEKLMTLFSQAGPVIGFRLVYDRESGKPKGYGFCEYNSAAVAASALRNLDNIDYNGRPLRIGPAAGEQNSAEVAMTNNTTMKPPQESPYGEKCDPQQAGVAISQAVASLPPEQLFDLMQQMKQCIESNPNEARQLLLQNPQLAYALLQAQIIMKIVEPKVAIAMLTRSNEQIPQAVIETNPSVPVVPQMYLNPLQHQQAQQMAPPPGQQPPPQMQQYPPINIELLQHQHQQQQQQQGVNMYRQGVPMPPLQPPVVSMAPQMPQMPPPFNPFVGGGGPQMMPGGFAPPPQQQQQQQQPPPQMFAPHQSMEIKLESSVHQPQQQQPQQDSVAAEMMNYLGRTGETEKAALIMQVLNLSDEEVAKLPDDQRRSIEVLKNQLKKN